MKKSHPNGMGFKATIAAQQIMAGYDVTLSNKQYRRVAKVLHQWGFTFYSPSYYVWICEGV